MADLLIKNAKIATLRGALSANVYVEDGKISSIKKTCTERADNTIDAKGDYLLPGVIDSHVHFRYPGQEYKEGWKTGSAAAAAGGVTSVLDMPNNSPAITSVRELDEKRRGVGKKASIDYGFHFGATNDNIDEFMKTDNIASVKFYLGSTTGDLLVDEAVLFDYFSALAEKGVPATVHCEREALVKRFTERNKKKFRHYGELRPNVCEQAAVSAVIDAAKKSGAHVHICHLSTKEGLDAVRAAKSRGVNVSAEATPHHLFLNQKDEDRLKTYAKMNPPLRSKADETELWRGVKDGSIDIIATDHAPHTPEEKDHSFLKAPAGVPGVETMLPLMLNEVSHRNLSLEALVMLLCEGPAQLFGIRNKGRIAEGYDADFVLVDLRGKHTIRNDSIFSRACWTPFDGMELRGKILRTFVRGDCVFDRGVPARTKGEELSFESAFGG